MATKKIALSLPEERIKQLEEYSKKSLLSKSVITNIALDEYFQKQLKGDKK